MIRLSCPSCGLRFKFSAEDAGKRARCRSCGHPFRLPATVKAAEAPAGGHGAPASLPGNEGGKAVSSQRCVCCGAEENLATYSYWAAKSRERRWGGSVLVDGLSETAAVCDACARREKRPSAVGLFFYILTLAGPFLAVAISGLGIVTYKAGSSTPESFTPLWPLMAVVVIGIVAFAAYRLLKAPPRPFGAMAALRARVMDLRANGYKHFGEGRLGDAGHGDGSLGVVPDGRSRYDIYNENLARCR